MKHHNKDYFVHSATFNKHASVSKVELFMEKVQLAKDISKVRNIQTLIYPHYKKFVLLASEKLQLTKENNPHLRLYKSI